MRLSGAIACGAALAATACAPATAAAATVHVELARNGSLGAVAGTLRGAGVTRSAPLFVRAPAALARDRTRLQARSGAPLPDLRRFYRLELPDGGADALVARLRRIPAVASAYRVPPPAPPPVSPDFTAEQEYRLAPPGGVGDPEPAEVPGADGERVKVIDLEYGWRLNHEDVTKLAEPGAVIRNGTPVDPFPGDDHGVAVMGVLLADRNDFGVTGIVPDARAGLVNTQNAERGLDYANAIDLARQNMAPGDVMVLEQQTTIAGVNGFVPIEAVPDVAAAIRFAVAQGIVVVEAAGNGSVDLDALDLEPDTGAIMVGAGTTPRCGGNHARRPDSNHGARVDVQGWGECVVTAGYGSLYGFGPDAYTAGFGGTSGATAVVAGVAAAYSSAFETLEGRPPTPAEVRAAVRTGGTPQASPSDEIGPLPNLPLALGGLVDRVAPDAPGGFTAQLVGDDAFDLAWSAATDNVGVTGYEVVRDGVPIASPVVATSFRDGSLGRGVTHTYAVVALDAAGNRSPASAGVTVTTRPLPPPVTTVPRPAPSPSPTPTPPGGPADGAPGAASAIDPRAPGLALASSRLRVRNGRATLVLRNANPFAIAGTLVVRGAHRIATARIRLAAAGSGRVTFRLSAAARRTLRRRGRLRATAVITVAGPDGPAVTVRRRVTLRR